MQEQRKQSELQSMKDIQYDLFYKLKSKLPNKKKTPPADYNKAVKKLIKQQYKRGGNMTIINYKHTPNRAMILKQIMKSKSLLSFEIWGSDPTEKFFKTLNISNKIYCMTFVCCDIGDKYGKYLSLMNLEFFQRLLIIQDRVTNKGLKELSKLQFTNKQSSIKIHNSNITMDGLRYLKYLSNQFGRQAQLIRDQSINSIVHLKQLCKSYNQVEQHKAVYYRTTQNEDYNFIYFPHLAKLPFRPLVYGIRNTIFLDKILKRQPRLIAPNAVKTLMKRMDIQYIYGN